jgi:pyruvate,water dikinase
MHAVILEEAHETSLFGGKAVQLGAALRAGMPTPPGFALPVSLVDAIAARQAEAIARAAALYVQLGGALAVRSSAVGEDSADASFAGQHLTVLNVRSGDAIVEAVERVWQSGRSESALAYRRKLGIAGAPQVAVVVQRLVEPDCAGVLFTRNPVDGADERLVEAAWGLGEVVVAGLVTPDQYRISRAGVVLSRTPGNKDLAILPQPDGGTAEVELDEQRAAELCLSDAQLLELHALASRCEAVYGGTQDLEWAYAGGRLYLLQRRTLTR